MKLDPVAFEQHADVARRDAVARRDRGDRQVRAREVRHDVGLDGAQPRRAQAAAARDLGGIAGCAKRERHEVGDMVGDLRRHQRIARGALDTQQLDISGKQAQGAGVRRGVPDGAIVEAANRMGEIGATQPDRGDAAGSGSRAETEPTPLNSRAEQPSSTT